jgi:hypothetical protein
MIFSMANEAERSKKCTASGIVSGIAAPAAGLKRLRKSQNRSHSEERSDEESLFLRASKLRGIPRFARNDGAYAFFRNLLGRKPARTAGPDAIEGAVDD